MALSYWQNLRLAGLQIQLMDNGMFSYWQEYIGGVYERVLMLAIWGLDAQYHVGYR